jgi:hypothetical protein
MFLDLDRHIIHQFSNAYHASATVGITPWLFVVVDSGINSMMEIDRMAPTTTQRQ